MNVRPLLAAWAGLMVLLALTVGASFLPLGPTMPLVSYTIAAAKAALVLWFFMEMRGDSGLQRIALGSAFFALTLLFIMLASDNVTRGFGENLGV